MLGPVSLLYNTCAIARDMVEAVSNDPSRGPRATGKDAEELGLGRARGLSTSSLVDESIAIRRLGGNPLGANKQASPAYDVEAMEDRNHSWENTFIHIEHTHAHAHTPRERHTVLSFIQGHFYLISG